VIKRLHATIANQVYDHPYEKQLAEFWADHYHEIGMIVNRAEQLGRMLQNKSPECVLCHADIHTANVLIDTQGELFIVDWDEPVLAPKERDLMFVTVGGFVTEERHEALFFQGYGKTEIDPVTLAYYRYERVMEDLAEFGRHVFLADTSDEVRYDSMHWFMVQFAPGGLVEAAHRLDYVLPD
jgi:spectinomycin phosphotransferase